MSNKIIFQFGLVIVLLVFSTLGAWYEGSEILDRPSEWKYSTPFTHLFSGGINDPTDISVIDYFVYAAKFKPIYPLLMLINSVYLLTLLAYVCLKQYKKGFTIFNFILGGLLILFSLVLYNSRTEGAQFIFYVSLVIGILYIGVTYLFSTQSKRKILNLIKK